MPGKRRDVGIKRSALLWYVKRWLKDAWKGKKGEDVKKLLELAQRNKGRIGWAVGGIAGALTGLGYEGAANVVTLIAGILLGGAYLEKDKDAREKHEADKFYRPDRDGSGL